MSIYAYIINMPAKLHHDKFIERSIERHGEKYKYDKAKYVDTRTKVDIFCVKCNNYFKIRPDNFMGGAGCHKCSRINNGCKPSSTDKFIKKALLKHGDKLYKYDKVKYVKAHIKIEIYCNKCNKYFLQAPTNHLMGQGCKTCGQEKIKLSKTKEVQYFIQKAIKVHGDKRYDYSSTIFKNGETKVTIHCNLCNTDFSQKQSYHLKGSGCLNCQSSKGEIFLQNFLNTYNIKYEIQKRFPECRGVKNRALPFDIWCPDYNILIEHNYLYDELIGFFFYYFLVIIY